MIANAASPLVEWVIGQKERVVPAVLRPKAYAVGVILDNFAKKVMAPDGGRVVCVVADDEHLRLLWILSLIRPTPKNLDQLKGRVNVVFHSPLWLERRLQFALTYDARGKSPLDLDHSPIDEPTVTAPVFDNDLQASLEPGKLGLRSTTKAA